MGLFLVFLFCSIDLLAQFCISIIQCLIQYSFRVVFCYLVGSTHLIRLFIEKFTSLGSSGYTMGIQYIIAEWSIAQLALTPLSLNFKTTPQPPIKHCS